MGFTPRVIEHRRRINDSIQPMDDELKNRPTKEVCCLELLLQGLLIGVLTVSSASGLG